MSQYTYLDGRIVVVDVHLFISSEFVRLHVSTSARCRLFLSMCCHTVVCVSVCARHTDVPCKNIWTDCMRCRLQRQTFENSGYHVTDGGAFWRHLENTIEQPVHNGQRWVTQKWLNR